MKNDMEINKQNMENNIEINIEKSLEGRFCPSCKAEIMGDTVKCPLCGGKLEGEMPKRHWPEPKRLKQNKYIFRAQFLVLFLCAILSFVEFMLEDPKEGLLKGIIAIGWVLIGELIAYRIIKIVHTPLAGILQCGLLVIIFDILTSFLYPIVLIGIPFILTGIIIFDFIVILVDKTGATYGYFMVNVVVGIITLILAVFARGAKVDIIWTVCIIIFFATIGITMLVRGPKLIREIKNKMSF